MNELKEPVRKKDDEIDLREVFSRIGAGFDQFTLTFKRLLNLALRNLFLVLVITLIGLGIGYWFFITKKPFYKSSMTLVLHHIRNEFVEDQLNRLSDMIEDGNHAAIASRLEISPEAAAQIRSFKFSNLDENRVDEDSVLTGSPFRIEMTIFDNSFFATMEPALVNYMESNKFFSKLKQIREAQTRKVITKLRDDIASIDTVRTTVIAPKGPVSGFVYGEALDPTELYRQSLNMYKEQVGLEADLDRLDNIEVVNSFVPRIKPAGPKLEVYLTIAGILGLIVGLIAAGQLEKRRRGV